MVNRQRLINLTIGILAITALVGCTPNLPDDLPGLMRAMGDYDMNVSWHATDKVRRLYGKEGLAQALRHQNAYTRANAAHFLMFYRSPDVERVLIATSKDSDDHVRMWVAWSLGEIGGDAARSTLLELSHDSAEIVKMKAGEALEKLDKRHSSNNSEVKQDNALGRPAGRGK